MSVDIYAGKFIGKHVEPVVSLKHSDTGSYDEHGNWEYNADYIPGACMTMSGGNWLELMRQIGFTGMDVSKIPLKDIRIAAVTALEERQDPYFVQRLIELANICSLGITRGATQIVVV
jgi:hypothetical protein